MARYDAAAAARSLHPARRRVRCPGADAVGRRTPACALHSGAWTDVTFRQVDQLRPPTPALLTLIESIELSVLTHGELHLPESAQRTCTPADAVEGLLVRRRRPAFGARCLTRDGRACHVASLVAALIVAQSQSQTQLPDALPERTPSAHGPVTPGTMLATRHPVIWETGDSEGPSPSNAETAPVELPVEEILVDEEPREPAALAWSIFPGAPVRVEVSVDGVPSMVHPASRTGEAMGGDQIDPESARDLESRLRRLCSLAERAFVTGVGGRTVALVALDPAKVLRWGLPIAGPEASVATLAASADCHFLVEAAVAAVNARLPESQRIHAFAILDESLAGDVSRQELFTGHAALLDQLAGAATRAPLLTQAAAGAA